MWNYFREFFKRLRIHFKPKIPSSDLVRRFCPVIFILMKQLPDVLCLVLKPFCKHPVYPACFYDRVDIFYKWLTWNGMMLIFKNVVLMNRRI